MAQQIAYTELEILEHRKPERCWPEGRRPEPEPRPEGRRPEPEPRPEQNVLSASTESSIENFSHSQFV